MGITGFERGMYRDLESIAKSMKILHTTQQSMLTALETIAASLEKIANPPLCGVEVFTTIDGKEYDSHPCGLPYDHSGDCR